MLSSLALPLTAAGAIVFAAEYLLHRWRMDRVSGAQEQLRRAKEEAFEAVQLSLCNPYPLLQVTEEGRVIFLNPAASDLFPGIQKTGIRHPVLSGFARQIRNGHFSREAGFGESVYHQTIVPVRTGGRPTYIIYFFDITPRKTYERSLKESRQAAEAARAAAEKANRARGEFLANMSHELRTPMNGIIGLTDILVDTAMSAEQRELIASVNSSAQNLLILLNDILDFSKIEAGELTLETIPFDLRQVVQQAFLLHKPAALRKGLEISASIAPDLPTHVSGDPARLQQILNNLLSNALKFTEAGSVRLQIEGGDDGKGNIRLRICVRDTGIGISKHRQQIIFEKFCQADESTARKYGGTGLGLAIARQLAQLMGGGIYVESDEGRGAAFTVTLQFGVAAAGAESAPHGAVAAVPRRINRKARIMLVDDHPVNLLYMKQALMQMGCRNLSEATNGAQAVRLFQEEYYDLILMDCKMPDMDGFEAARNMRILQRPGFEPIIIAVTADAMKSAEDKCREAGMDDYISKPVSKNKLYSIIERWLPADVPAHIPPGGTEKPSPGAATGAAPIIFNWDHFHDFTNGDSETQKMLIDLFLESLDADLKRLQECFRVRSYEEWEAAAHKMSGASSHIGAEALAVLCDRAQDIDAGKPGEMDNLHHLIVRESQRLQQVLQAGARAA